MDKLVIFAALTVCLVSAGHSPNTGRERLQIRAGSPLVGRAWHGRPNYHKSLLHNVVQWHEPGLRDVEEQEMEEELASLPNSIDAQSSPQIPPQVAEEIVPEANHNQVEPPPVPVSPPEPVSPPVMTEDQMDDIMKTLGNLLGILARDSYKFKVLNDRDVVMGDEAPVMGVLVELARTFETLVQTLGSKIPRSIQHCMDLGTQFPSDLITPTRRVGLLGRLLLTQSESSNLEVLEELPHLAGIEALHEKLVILRAALEDHVVEEVPTEAPTEESEPINNAIHDMLDMDDM